MADSLAQSRVLRKIAELYAGSQAGRTGQEERDWLVDFRELLEAAECEDGDERAQAQADLVEAETRGILRLERHRRDADLIERVRLPRGRSAALFAVLDEISPSEKRNRLARQIAKAAQAIGVPAQWRERWQSYLLRLELAALKGASVLPFSREDPQANEELLALLPKLLGWEGESLIRFASCELCGDSKRLGELANKLNRILTEASGGQIQNLEALGILANPRSVLLHGPLRLQRSRQWIDFGPLQGPVRISGQDLVNAEKIETAAGRCLTVENETTFAELAKLQSGVLLVCTSFPGSATLSLIKALPATMEFWHFGDSDPAGFEILRDLRARTGRPFKSLHMSCRADPQSALLTAEEKQVLERLIQDALLFEERSELNAILSAGRKGRFEQEFFGKPFASWPFYPERKGRFRL